MGGSKGGSVGSYSSGSADPVGDVLGKYGTNAAGGHIAKVSTSYLRRYGSGVARLGGERRLETLVDNIAAV